MCGVYGYDAAKLDILDAMLFSLKFNMKKPINFGKMNLFRLLGCNLLDRRLKWPNWTKCYDCRL